MGMGMGTGMGMGQDVSWYKYKYKASSLDTRIFIPHPIYSLERSQAGGSGAAKVTKLEREL